MRDLFLYEELDLYKRDDLLNNLPDVIEDNLSPNIELRDYQVEAFKYFITNFENKADTKQIHNLFHMATGSGKTVIMAGLILYLYSKGYRNFIFFVNQKNILEKTKDNFNNSTSSKYLFNESINYLGEKIKIHVVDNFQYTNSNAINICFTTTQTLHINLWEVKENNLTFADFEDKKIVLISDESHHLNSSTKKSESSTEKIERESWEYSINHIFRTNKNNVLLEFTATCDLNNTNIKTKYLDKIVYNYPLLNFRESGYTKDFENYQSNTELFERSLRALIFSEYRSYLFTDLNKNIKPVILMKSSKIPESKLFFKEFYKKLKELKNLDLINLYKQEQKNVVENHLFLEALEYFYQKDPSFNLLENSLKDSFSIDKSILIDSQNIDSEKQLYLNSLEDNKNPYRIIFAVDMLNEGWDVLNLFDIVRLYDKRQASGVAGKIGKYTMQEAQLIGRGARYCPFKAEDWQDKYTRKYDYDTTNKYRILEKMLFHCSTDSRYIAELTAALKEIGFEPEKEYKLNYKVKPEFKDTDVYKKGIIFSNKRIPKGRKNIQSVEGYLKSLVIKYDSKTGRGKTSNFFNPNLSDNSRINKNLFTVKLKNVSYNIVLGASERFDNLRFNIIKRKYPNLKSFSEFIKSDDYLGNITLELSTTEEALTSIDYYKSCIKLFGKVSKFIGSIKQEFEGSKVFAPKKISSVIKDKSIYMSSISSNGGKGVSQNETFNSDYQLDLTQEDWYIFNDNYGTSEEKLFIKYFKTDIKPKLDEKGLEYYVIRNERVPQLAIYNFEHGERFEPDFVLIARRKGSDTTSNYQIYAEPKGNQLLLLDKWKEDFLIKIESNSIPDNNYVYTEDYKIMGLPFYNGQFKKIEFEKAVDEWVETI